MHAVRRGSGEPLVLLHGIGSVHTIWDPVVPALAERYEVVAFDLPGCGESPPLQGEPSLTALAGAVAAELDHRGLTHPHVVGNSLGGLVALELAAAGRARSVVALGPAGAQNLAEAAYTRAVLLSARGLARALGSRTAGLSRSRGLRQATMWWSFARPGALPPEAAAEMAAAFRDSIGFERTLLAMPARLSAQRLAQVTCPVLVAWGTKDRLLSPRGAERLAADLPRAEVRMLDGLGHVPMWDDPGTVAGVVLDFVDKLA